jgi:hypothetical protein
MLDPMGEQATCLLSPSTIQPAVTMLCREGILTDRKGIPSKEKLHISKDERHDVFREW